MTQLAINSTQEECLDSFNAACKQLKRELESPLERLHLGSLPEIVINADIDMDLPFTFTKLDINGDMTDE